MNDAVAACSSVSNPPSKVRIMGIVNVTPDSFWKKSRGLGHQGAELALQLVEEGADILDLGAESSRPGSQYVEAE